MAGGPICPACRNKAVGLLPVGAPAPAIGRWRASQRNHPRRKRH